MSIMPASSRASGLLSAEQATQATVHRLDATSSTPFVLPQASDGGSALARSGRALAIGNFDGVHRGHQAIIRKLTQYPDLVPAVLSFEPHPRHFFAHQGKGSAPDLVNTLRDRVAGLMQAGAQEVFLGRFNQAMAGMPAEQFIERLLVKRLQVRELLVGDDFRFGAARQGDFEMLERAGQTHGFSVARWPQVQIDGRRVSSSWVRDTLRAGDLDLTKRLLGHPYRITGHVLHGQKLGRKLGFPTINLRVPRQGAGAATGRLSGVLAVQVHGLAGHALDGVASWGTRPAVTQGGHPLLEIHIMDWAGDAYGRVVQVDCLHKLRDEANFASLDALTEQIRLDTMLARQWLAKFKDHTHG